MPAILSDIPIPVLGIAAFSGTGKTTLLEKVLPLLNDKGLRTGLVKASHHTLEQDSPGKDSFRLRHAGAQQLVLSTPGRSICYTEYPSEYKRSLKDQLRLLNHSALDLILVEGFREAAIPKIELHRNVFEKPFLFEQDPNIIAIAWDDNPGVVVPQYLTELNINHPGQVATFIEAFVHRANEANHE